MRFPLISVRPMPYHKFKVLETFTFMGITVDEGYETNGADIPVIFRWYHIPNDSTTLPAVIVHDLLIDKAETIDDCKYADDKFKECLSICKIPNHKKIILPGTVKLWTSIVRRATYALYSKVNCKKDK